jgi:long-chain acyl-CoA synthetase
MKKRKGIDISIKSGKRVVSGLGYYKTRQIKDIKELVKDTIKLKGDKVGFKFKDNKGNIVGKTYNEFGDQIDSLGTALISLGLKNTHISIISENRYEWGVCYFSIINGTGIAVPMDKYLPEEEVENLIERGNVQAIFYSAAFHNIMVKIAKKNQKIKYYICMDEITDSLEVANSLNVSNKEDKISNFTTVLTLINKGRKLIESGNCSFIDACIDPNKMSILLFTSGTTNISKGVMLSHANIVSNVLSIASTIKTYNTDTYLSLLPLHHTFENTVGLMFMIYNGICIGYCDGIRHIAQNIHEYGVTLLVAVPAIFEAMYRRVEAGIKASGKEKSVKILGWISSFLYSIGIDIRRKLFKSVLSKLGPGLRLAVSGAAPLDPKVVIGFHRMGLRLLQGYGLTETSPVVSANNDFINVPGSIGHPLGDIEVAIDMPDENGIGEIITRGQNVMLGYYENLDATKEVIDKEGWFRTGDLGSIDKKGVIKITGRAKSMIVLTNGKKAFPEEYEILLNNLDGIKESFVWGNVAPDGDIQVCAKLVIDSEKIIDMKSVEANTKGIKNSKIPSEEELTLFFLRDISKAIKEINKTMPKYKIIRYFIITNDDLIKTTTLKIKRSLEYEKTMNLLKEIDLDMRKANGMLINSR